MELFLLRHGHAVPSAPRDSERELSSQGREDLSMVLQPLTKELNQIEKVLCSPFIRTRQTLEVAKQYLPAAVDSNITYSENLTPDANYLALASLLETMQETSVLLVTHQPLVELLLNWLCGFAPGEYRMGTSAIAAIDIDPVAAGLGELRWLKQPI